MRRRHAIRYGAREAPLLLDLRIAALKIVLHHRFAPETRTDDAFSWLRVFRHAR